MTNAEAINWIINISADIGKAEHSELWHYEQALSEIREMLEDKEPQTIQKGKWIHIRCGLYECSECGQIHTALNCDNYCDANFCPNCGAKNE